MPDAHYSVRWAEQAEWLTARGACTISRAWSAVKFVGERRIEGLLLPSLFFFFVMHLIQKDRCDCKMRSFVSVSQPLTSAAPSHNYGGMWHYSRSRRGDPLIYYSLSAGPAHVTCTVSCVLIKAHPMRGIWSPTSNATQPLNRFKLDHFHVEEKGTGGNLFTTDFYSWQHIKASKNQSPNHHIALKVAVEIQITALFQPPSLRKTRRENAI